MLPLLTRSRISTFLAMVKHVLFILPEFILNFFDCRKPVREWRTRRTGICCCKTKGRYGQYRLSLHPREWVIPIKIRQKSILIFFLVGISDSINHDLLRVSGLVLFHSFISFNHSFIVFSSTDENNWSPIGEVKTRFSQSWRDQGTKEVAR